MMENVHQMHEWNHVAFLPDLIIKGVPGSPGVAEGSATVVTDPEKLSNVKAGAILVCPHMSREMTAVFPDIKAVVSDNGSLLAAPSIVARECGIPAVVGTRMAAESIRDGDIIRVDGTRGVVKVLSRSQ